MSVLFKTVVSAGEVITCLPTLSDGWLFVDAGVYVGAHDQPNAYYKSSLTDYVYAGQGVTIAIPSYYIGRSVLFFDTTPLAGKNIVSGLARCYCSEKANADDQLLVLVDGSGCHDPLVNGDFGELLLRTSPYGLVSISSISAGSYFDIPLTDLGLAAINKGGVTKYGLRTSEDITTTVPTQVDEIVRIPSAESGSPHYPLLLVTVS